jgi:hypothetical protein
MILKTAARMAISTFIVALAILVGTGMTGIFHEANAGEAIFCIVASVTGEVRLISKSDAGVRCGAPVPMRAGAELKSDDVVETSPTGGATLLYKDGRVVELSGASRLKIDDRKDAKSERGIASAFTRAIFGDGEEEGIGTGSATRSVPSRRDGKFLLSPILLAKREKSEYPEPLLPLGRTLSSGNKVRFLWRPALDARAYRVAIFEAGKENKVVAAFKVEGDFGDVTVELPAAAAAAGRELAWRVFATNSGGIEKGSESFRISFATLHETRSLAAEIEALPRFAIGNPASSLLTAIALMNKGLYTDAIWAFHEYLNTGGSFRIAENGIKRCYSRLRWELESCAR